VLAGQLDPDVVLEVDTYWATAGGVDAPELLRRLGDRVRALHIKDGDLNTDGSGQVPAGQGRVPVTAVLAAAPRALRVVEFDRFTGDIFGALAASLAFLQANGGVQ
jgi:sugar phosphate isomerase/epimerase